MREREISLLNNLIVVINLSKPKQEFEDKWKWKLGKFETYTTRGAYDEIVRRNSNAETEEREEFKLIWKSAAVPKTRIHAWRVIW